ncbi:hypothetical protein CPB83DRAFT_794652 [Crepidotus variabilis]|uniref:Uncharacterized protein n=1 Tax=Crepidotus variabilis TaxID=179855 RepID=A0A9P6EBT2_9AGAR|nr:hypothetical protein CPB83DRAFT_794652 [Crepidotus variabilis]
MYLLLNFLSFLFYVRAVAISEQTSFNSQRTTTWDFSREPLVNSTGRWIFDNVNSFLKLRPNARFRNGHSIVPGVIPTGTVLYHGRGTPRLPTEPDWVSVDPEHSRLFFSVSHGEPETNGTKECWHLTLAVTNPLKVIYFDGSGAAKMLGGSMDTQDILAWGNIHPDRTYDDWARIAGLCDWAKDFGVQGFVRMEMDFEVMLCDFKTNLEVVSMLRVQPPESVWSPNSTVSDTTRVLEAGTWHDQYPSERRIKLDYSRFISFYDTSLFPSLNLHRQGQGRWAHRLGDITAEELSTLRETLNESLQGEEWGVSRSGVDWPTLLMTVEQRYSERLSVLRYILFNLATKSDRTLEDVLKQAQRHIRDMINPYLLESMHSTRSSTPYVDSATTTPDLQWASPAFAECATNHIRYLEKPSTFLGLSHSEKLLLGAIRETLTEICRVLIGMWAEGAERGLAKNSVVLSDEDELIGAGLLTLADSWRSRTQGLMNWLDWSSWAACQPACSIEEMCYMSTWPWFMGLSGVISPEEYRPFPKCIRRVEPFNDSN